MGFLLHWNYFDGVDGLRIDSLLVALAGSSQSWPSKIKEWLICSRIWDLSFCCRGFLHFWQRGCLQM